jgi:hypothetical protein
MPRLMPEITVSAINCNSLNMSSTSSQTHKLKVYGRTSLRTDIILLSDTRLVSTQGVSGLSVLTASLLVNPYGAYIPYFNLTANKRGVGTLLRKSCDFSVEQEERDTAENILLLRLKKKGSNFQFIVGAIYGPNGFEPRLMISGDSWRQWGTSPPSSEETGTAASAAPTGMLTLIFSI